MNVCFCEINHFVKYSRNFRLNEIFFVQQEFGTVNKKQKKVDIRCFWQEFISAEKMFSKNSITI